jgi:hypothetical protein
MKLEKKEKQRTLAQNNAIHLWFNQLAEALADAGYDVKQVIRVEIPWTEYMVKELLWRPVQKALYGKRSTTELTTAEVTRIYDVINKTIGERIHVFVPFPSLETLEIKVS